MDLIDTYHPICVAHYSTGRQSHCFCVAFVCSWAPSYYRSATAYLPLALCISVTSLAPVLFLTVSFGKISFVMVYKCKQLAGSKYLSRESPGAISAFQPSGLAISVRSPRLIERAYWHSVRVYLFAYYLEPLLMLSLAITEKIGSSFRNVSSSRATSISMAVSILQEGKIYNSWSLGCFSASLVNSDNA